MGESALSRAIVFESARVARAVKAEDPWRSMTADLADSLTRSANECLDQLRSASDPVLRDQLRSLRGTALSCLEDVRVAREAVERANLEADGLLEDLRRLARRFAAESGIDVDLRTPRSDPALAPEIAWVIHSVADEALEGLVKLSRATGVVLTLASSERGVTVAIRDDGVGLIARQGRGWRASPLAALRTIRRLVEPMRGSARLWSLRPRGLVLTADIPT